eukprot:scaffold1886_cov298-Alexandrium_tamarense.AAC.7
MPSGLPRSPRPPTHQLNSHVALPPPCRYKRRLVVPMFLNSSRNRCLSAGRRYITRCAHHRHQQPLPFLKNLRSHHQLYHSTSQHLRGNEPSKLSIAEIAAQLMHSTASIFTKILSTIQTFQQGLSLLKSDFLTSLHIQDAEMTRLHLQRKLRKQHEDHKRRLRRHERHGIHVLNEAGEEMEFRPSSMYHAPSSDKRSGTNHNESHWNYYQSHYLTTRRPQEHLRQISRDLQTTLPTVTAFMFIPFVGYSFLLLGMMFPRYLLSRQFHTREQRWEFSTLEYKERKRWWRDVSNDFWGSCSLDMPKLMECNQEVSGKDTDVNNCKSDSVEVLSYTGMDTAGPVFDEQSMVTLYNLMQNITGSTKNSISAFATLPTSYLQSLALSSNMAAKIPLPITTVAPVFIQTCVPRRYLQSMLTTMAEDILMDDVALLEEEQLNARCRNMTDDEVLQACWLRGLPVGRFVNGVGLAGNYGDDCKSNELRELLTHHLQMMQLVMMHCSSSLILVKGKLIRDIALQMMVLHLQPLRYQMMLDQLHR